MCQNKEVGFIYLIHDTINDRMYIGKKHYLKGGKLHKGESSDWKSYCSSSKEIQAVVDAIGKDGFLFYVLEEYRLRGSLGFAETWSLMHVEALAHRDKWYNGLVNKVSWTVKESVTQKHKDRLATIVAGNGSTLSKWEATCG